MPTPPPTQSWLLGYELTDTISVFTADSIYFLSSKKKIEFLRQAEGHKESGVPAIKLLVRDRVSIAIVIHRTTEPQLKRLTLPLLIDIDRPTKTRSTSRRSSAS